jgi:hypothetical protein
MKDTEVEIVVALTGIAVEEGGGWKITTLASAERVGCWLRRYCPRPVHGTITNSEDSKHNKHYV